MTLGPLSDPGHQGTDMFEDESYCRIKIAPLYYPPNETPRIEFDFI